MVNIRYVCGIDQIYLWYHQVFVWYWSGIFMVTSDIMLIFIRYISSNNQVYVWYKSGMCVVYVRYVCGIYQVCMWFWESSWGDPRRQIWRLWRFFGQPHVCLKMFAFYLLKRLAVATLFSQLLILNNFEKKIIKKRWKILDFRKKSRNLEKISDFRFFFDKSRFPTRILGEI